MKVLHIIVGLNNGGAESVLSRLCINDACNQHSVVSLMDLGKYGPVLQREGVAVYCLQYRRGHFSLRGLWRLWLILRSECPDVVQTWMYHADLVGGLMARLAGVRNVIWNIRHSELDPERSSRVTIFIARICARLSKFVPRRIIVCAHHSAEIHVGLGYDRNRMFVIGNGFDFSRFYPDSFARAMYRERFGIASEALVIGFVARFDPQKDHKNFFAAVSILQKSGYRFETVLIGPGMTEANAELLQMCQDLTNISLLGTQDDIPGVMSFLDLHVLSSSAEGFPNVLAEAMACGTPCVTTDVGDASIIVGETGWVVPPKNANALAEAISFGLIEMVSRPDNWLRRKILVQDRIRSEFGIDQMILRYHDVWHE